MMGFPVRVMVMSEMVLLGAELAMGALRLAARRQFMANDPQDFCIAADFLKVN